MSSIWIDREEIMRLPTRGPAWDAVLATAEAYQGGAALGDPNSQDNNGCLAAALVAVRTGSPSARASALAGIDRVVDMAERGTYGPIPGIQGSGTALALARNLGAFVIADGLLRTEPPDAGAAGPAFHKLLTAPCVKDPPTVLETHELRPNNWGLHAGFARACVYAYRGDTWGLAEVARIFRTWVGEADEHIGFQYGGPFSSRDFSWQADAGHCVGINPRHAMIDGHPVDGVQPEEQRRAGPFAWPPTPTNYSWEGLQGAVATAWVLSRNGYPDAFAWGHYALYRAASWLVNVAGHQPTGDDRWIPWLLVAAGDSPAVLETPTTPGKNVGFTDWTHHSMRTT